MEFVFQLLDRRYSDVAQQSITGKRSLDPQYLIRHPGTEGPVYSQETECTPTEKEITVIHRGKKAYPLP